MYLNLKARVVGLRLDELDSIKNLEILNYRLELLKLIRKELNQDYDLMHFFHSPNLEIDLNRISSVKTQLGDKENEFIDVCIHNIENGTCQVLTFSLEQTPNEILREYFRVELASLVQSEGELRNIVDDYENSYLLNVCGCNDVLYRNEHSIGSYKVRVFLIVYFHAKPSKFCMN